MYGHFGPKTRRTQDIRQYVFGAEVSHIFAMVPKLATSCQGVSDSLALKHETLWTQN